MSSSSSFSSLLHRSKIASYDPLITRVYTSPKTSRQRGDWGLKDTLPAQNTNRSRSKFIRVQSLDDPSGIGCDWRGAEKEGRFMEKWGDGRHGWGNQQEVDKSDSASSNIQLRAGVLGIPSTIAKSRLSREGSKAVNKKESWMPDVESMSENRFERYLDELRATRTSFTSPPSPTTSSSAPTPKGPSSWSSDGAGESARHISKITTENLACPTSTDLHPRPHPRFGLSYSRASPYMVERTPSLELPGRQLNPFVVDRTQYYDSQNKRAEQNFKAASVSPLDNQNRKIAGAGGLTGIWRHSSNSGEFATSTTRPEKTSVQLRISKAVVRTPPTVVSSTTSGEVPVTPMSVMNFPLPSKAKRPSSLDAARVSVDFSSPRPVGMEVPGSREWVKGDMAGSDRMGEAGISAALRETLSQLGSGGPRNSQSNSAPRSVGSSSAATVRSLLEDMLANRGIAKKSASPSKPTSDGQPTANVPRTKPEASGISGPGIGGPDPGEETDDVAEGGWRELEENVAGEADSLKTEEETDKKA